MSTKTTRRRIIDSTCVPLSRRCSKYTQGEDTIGKSQTVTISTVKQHDTSVRVQLQEKDEEVTGMFDRVMSASADKVEDTEPRIPCSKKSDKSLKKQTQIADIGKLQTITISTVKQLETDKTMLLKKIDEDDTDLSNGAMSAPLYTYNVSDIHQLVEDTETIISSSKISDKSEDKQAYVDDIGNSQIVTISTLKQLDTYAGDAGIKRYIPMTSNASKDKRTEIEDAGNSQKVTISTVKQLDTSWSMHENEKYEKDADLSDSVLNGSFVKEEYTRKICYNYNTLDTSVEKHLQIEYTGTPQTLTISTVKKLDAGVSLQEKERCEEDTELSDSTTSSLFHKYNVKNIHQLVGDTGTLISSPKTSDKCEDKQAQLENTGKTLTIGISAVKHLDTDETVQLRDKSMEDAGVLLFVTKSSLATLDKAKHMQAYDTVTPTSVTREPFNQPHNTLCTDKHVEDTLTFMVIAESSSDELRTSCNIQQHVESQVLSDIVSRQPNYEMMSHSENGNCNSNECVLRGHAESTGRTDRSGNSVKYEDTINSVPCLLDQNRASIIGKEEATDVHVGLVVTSSEVCVPDPKLNETTDLITFNYEYNHSSKIIINPILDVIHDADIFLRTETDCVSNIQARSDMFETNIEDLVMTGKVELPHSMFSETIVSKTNDTLQELFRDDEVLSSLPDYEIHVTDDYANSIMNSDVFGAVLKCHSGHGLYDDEPSAIHEHSSCFALTPKQANEAHESKLCQEQKSLNNDILDGKDPNMIEQEMAKTVSSGVSCWPNGRGIGSTVDLFDVFVHQSSRDNPVVDAMSMQLEMDEEASENEDVYSGLMEGSNGAPRLLSVEEKWQIIFNEKTRAPIYAVSQYIEYLNQFVSGRNAASRDTNDVIKKDGINPISYLLRKLKLDLKMSYDSFVEEFIKPSSNGMGLLVKLLKSIQNTESQQSGSTNMAQLKNYKKTLTDEHDCLLCIKYSLRLKRSLTILLDITYGLETVCMGVISTYTKCRGTAIEILTVCLSAEEGFARTLDCFTYIQLKIGERVRFKSLINMMNMAGQQNTVFKVSTMKFLNSLLDASSNTNIRVYLQHELETAGLDIDCMQQKASGNGLEFDDLRRELSEWQRKYLNVDTILSQRGNVARRITQPANQKMVEELQLQVKKLSADKSYMEYQLKAVSTELRNRYEELQQRIPIQQDAHTQCNGVVSSSNSIGCQCDLVQDNGKSVDTMKTAGEYFGWKDVYINDEQDVYYPATKRDNSKRIVDSDQGQEITTLDDEGVVKVQHWLHSHCGSSETRNKLNDHQTESSLSECPTFYFKRNSLTRRKVRKTEFPGNWKLIPKSIEPFPSRFPPHQCHQTNCDRCDLRNRPENSGPKHSDVLQNFTIEMRLNDLVKHKNRTDVRSQSSDSAIGGSGERLWNERRIPLVAIGTEAEILQDLIQPDDSASACPTSEPYPDYSSVMSKFNSQRSYRRELSQVLREFEGNLLQYDSNERPHSEVFEKYVTLGDI